MDLDDFVENGSEAFSSEQKSSEPSSETEQRDYNAHKVIEFQDEGKIIVPTQSVWKDIVKVLENEMRLELDKVMEMKDLHKYELIHQASLVAMGYDVVENYPIKNCVVCEKRFVFPTDWDFIRIRGEVSCRDHSVRKVMDSVRKINDPGD